MTMKKGESVLQDPEQEEEATCPSLCERMRAIDWDKEERESMGVESPLTMALWASRLRDPDGLYFSRVCPDVIEIDMNRIRNSSCYFKSSKALRVFDDRTDHDQAQCGHYLCSVTTASSKILIHSTSHRCWRVVSNHILGHCEPEPPAKPKDVLTGKLLTRGRS